MNVPAHDHRASASPPKLASSALKKPSFTPLEPGAKARGSKLGLPHFKWSMALLGLCIYSFAIITFKFPVAQLGIAVGVAGLFMGGNPVRMPTPFLLFSAFLLWALITSFISPFSDVAIDAVMERCKLLIIILLALNAFQTEGQLRFYLLFVLGCFMLFPARGTFIGGDTVMGRVVWNFIYNNPNDLAALSLLALGIALAITFSEAAWTYVRLGAVFSAVLLLIVILRTQSRGTFLGLVVATAPAFIPMLFKQLRRAIVVGIVVALVANFTVPQTLWDRLSGIQKLTSTDTIAEADTEGSAGQRFEILKVGWQIFLDHPVFGVGLGAYPLANNMYSPSLGKRDTHNTYVNLAAEVGLPGLAIWCALVGSVLLRAYGIRRRAAESLLKVQNYWLSQTIIGFLVAGIFGSFAPLNLLYLILSVLACSTTLLQNTTRSANPQAQGGAHRTGTKGMPNASRRGIIQS